MSTLRDNLIFNGAEPCVFCQGQRPATAEWSTAQGHLLVCAMCAASKLPQFIADAIEGAGDLHPTERAMLYRAVSTEMNRAAELVRNRRGAKLRIIQNA